MIAKYCSAIQNGYQLIWDYFGKIPIPSPTPLEKEAITELVSSILAIKKANPTAVVAELEEQINQRAYMLYGLSEEEISTLLSTVP